MNRVVIEDDTKRKDDVIPEIDDFRKGGVSRPSNRMASFLGNSYFSGEENNSMTVYSG